MPAYAFEAIDADGRPRKGVLEADTARAARSMLRAQALIPLSVEGVAGGADAGGAATPLWRRRIGGRVFNATALGVWTRQLAGLVASGLPLERALTALTDEAESEPQRQLVASLRSEVNGGSSFARALAQHPREFSAIYTAVIGAGEHSGQLGLVLERLADDLEEQQALRQKLIGATLYPAIVTVIAVVIVIFLVSYVVPQVASVFAGTKRALPLLTQAMLGLSAFVRGWGWLMLGVLAVAVIGGKAALARDALRERFDAFWLRLPLVGKLARGYNAARFAGTLAMLAAAGVPILRALQAAAETLNNRAMRADALDALVLVREGAPLASALAQKKRFPGIVPMFARLGEQTGELPVMLQRAAKQLSAEVQRRAMHLATILEPLL
ncbi:MAG: type II secretion system F family protein, partial [Pseudacidovorax sp.]|nr:type II secretion system F family protein [Pseudacidovorax sp.]